MKSTRGALPFLCPTIRAPRLLLRRPLKKRSVIQARLLPIWLTETGAATLADIPQSELVELSERGITTLWLVGLWKRSAASQTIKERSGLKGVISSAYSIDDYIVDPAWGGVSSLKILKKRCSRLGMTLASDFVPNHLGLGSPVLYSHPELFISSKSSPYPHYNFDTPNLSSNPDFVLQLEKGYYDKTDAAVCFRLIKKSSGELYFIYHGNDGTHVPWNDTAQLDVTNPKTRKLMIAKMRRIKRLTPTIRLDAAMLLTKEHLQRLWWPVPNSSETSIPSREHFSISEEDFNTRIPREPLSLLAHHLPSAFLIAEAFWMTEQKIAKNMRVDAVYNIFLVRAILEKRHEQIARFIRDTQPLLPHFLTFLETPDESPIASLTGNEQYRLLMTFTSLMPGPLLIGHGQMHGLREKRMMDWERPREAYIKDNQRLEWHKSFIAPLLTERKRLEGSNLSVTANSQIIVLSFTTRTKGKLIGLAVFNNSAETALLDRALLPDAEQRENLRYFLKPEKSSDLPRTLRPWQTEILLC